MLLGVSTCLYSGAKSHIHMACMYSSQTLYSANEPNPTKHGRKQSKNQLICQVDSKRIKIKIKIVRLGVHSNRKPG